MTIAGGRNDPMQYERPAIESTESVEAELWSGGNGHGNRNGSMS
jgi:hypothetical protein